MVLREYCRWKVVLVLIILLSSFGLLLISLHYMSPFNIAQLRSLNYNSEWSKIREREKLEQFGNAVQWSECEAKANARIMLLKFIESEIWNRNETLKSLAGDFMLMRSEISRSLMYKILRRMPKGGALQLQNMALAGTEYLVKLTYEPYLWICIDFHGYYVKFLFSLTKPDGEVLSSARNSTCQWHLMSDLRSKNDSNQINDKLRRSLSITNLDKRQEKAKLKNIRSLLRGLLTYAPLWQRYLEHSLRQFINDGVQYLEIRSSLPRLYDLKGINYSPEDAVAMWRNVSKKLALGKANFFGIKLIYTVERNLNDTVIDGILGDAHLLQMIFSDFMAGLDFIDDEVPNSKPLEDLRSHLQKLHGNLDLYLSTDEANWFNRHADDNIIDAFLMGSKRLTFSTALLRHPYIIRQCKAAGVGIVLKPISNQIFHHMGDLRNHPFSMLLSYDLPLIISSDAPSYWQADPLTHEYYMLFMQIASGTADLKVLKQLAINSIVYSGLSNRQKVEALNSWKAQWYRWICYINNNL